MVGTFQPTRLTRLGLAHQSTQSSESEVDIVQNRDTVLDKDVFQFAACPVKSEAFLTGVSRQIEKCFSLAIFVT
jgi:hypothetical protein